MTIGWQSIAGYEGLYWVSDTGLVKSRRGLKSLQLNPAGNGYRTVHLFKNGRCRPHLVSRLVASAFIPNPENKPQVNHISGDTLDNRVQNLEWATRSENQRHAFRIGLNSAVGEKNRHAKLTETKVVVIRGLISIGIAQKDVARIFAIHPASVSYIHTRKTWNHI